MKKGKLILITGGSRSGKSTFAEKYALESKKRVFYLATAGADDDEMRERIRIHQENRPADFITVEEKLYPHRIIEKEQGEETLFLLDCLTLLLTNHLLKDVGKDYEQGVNANADDASLQNSAREALQYVEQLVSVTQKSPSEILIVTNEVGMGLVPEYPLGRLYRDTAGRANQIVAAAADEVWLMVCGLAQRIK